MLRLKHFLLIIAVIIILSIIHIVLAGQNDSNKNIKIKETFGPPTPPTTTGGY